MSTRSMTVLEDETTTLRLYRHCDGYPAVAGKALADALSGAEYGLEGAATNPTKAASRLLRLTDEAYAHRAAQPTYVLADWTPEDQGDLEHVYVARGPRSGWEVEHRRREWDGIGGVRWYSHTYTLPEFQEFCARECAELEARAAEYERRAQSAR